MITDTILYTITSKSLALEDLAPIRLPLHRFSVVEGWQVVQLVEVLVLVLAGPDCACAVALFEFIGVLLVTDTSLLVAAAVFVALSRHCCISVSMPNSRSSNH